MDISYDDLKKINVLRYIISKKVNNKINILKVVYMANKYHLQRYGREVVEDRYRAMEYGPVPFSIYDILKQIANEGIYNNAIDFSRMFSSMNNGLCYESNEKADFNYLSETDKECLDQAVNVLNHRGVDLAEERVSRDQAYSATRRNEEIPFVQIVKSLPNHKDLMQYLELEQI